MLTSSDAKEIDLETIYPYINKKLLYPLCETLYRSNIMSCYRQLVESDMYDEKTLQELQNRRIHSLAKHCYENVKYYRDLFKRIKLTPDDIRKSEDLAKVPILTKQIIRENYDSLISRDYRKRHVKYHSTGGSTGEPLRYLADSDTWSMAWASSFRAWKWYGLKVGEKIFTLAGSSLVGKKHDSLTRKDVFERVLMRNKKHNVFLFGDTEMMSHYESYLGYHPSAIRGYPSILYAFACFIEKNKLPVISPKVVLTTGEILLPMYRETIERVFLAPVYDSYGAGDGGIASHECLKKNGLHVTEERCYIEICNTNGTPVPVGDHGHVISTDLYNYTFPFIRYQVGDVSYIKKEKCSCGRQSKLLGEILGRSGKLLYTKAKYPVSPTILPIMLYPDLDYHKLENQLLYNNIDKFQILQDARGDLIIYLKMKSSKHEDPVLYSYIVKNYEEIFVNSRVDIQFVADIPLLPSGKESYVWSDFVPD